MTLTSEPDVTETSALFRYEPPTRLSSLSVVMPAHNEEENIETAILDALEAAALVTDDVEVVVVDDGSTDRTGAAVQAIVEIAGEGRVRLLVNERNLGYGPTVRRAWSAAMKDWILFTDSDRQFDIMHDLPRLVALADGADIVTGWRQHRQDVLLRRTNAHIFNAAGRLFFGTRTRDVDCAFKLMRRTSLQQLELTANSAMVNTEMYHQARRAGLVVQETAVRHLPRLHGESSGGDPRVIARAIREFFAMYCRFHSGFDHQVRLLSRIVAMLALVLGLGATLWDDLSGHVLSYGDAEAHLNIAKRVTDGLTAGLAQLGSVWLPLPHLLMAPFAANDWLWRSGLPGAIVNIPCLVLLSVAIYRLASLLTRDALAALVAPAAVLFNPNTLYLVGTPMTEILMLSTATISVYFLAHYLLRGDTRSLVLCAGSSLLASLSRYDGWALVVIEWAIVGIAVAARTRSRHAVDGTLVLFTTLAGAGVAGWLLWNQLIFGNPLYFADSVYGSSEQQKFFLARGYLPTYHSLPLSILYWLEDVRLIVGTAPLIAAAVGLAATSWWAVRRRSFAPLAIVVAAGSAFAFYVVSLYTGQASLILPTLARPGALYTMSNIRYGLQALLVIGVLLAALASLRPRLIAPVLIVGLAASSFWAMTTRNVWSYNDGTNGLSSQKVSKGPDSPKVEAWMRAHYTGGLVLMDDYRRPIGPVESGVPMHNFIGVGNKPYWKESLDNPGRFATWLVLQEASTDAVWSALTPQSRAILDDHFIEVYTSGQIHVFERRPSTSGLVVKRGQHLSIDGTRWNSVGVNSYDLLAQPDAIAVKRVDSIAASGFNTLRTWCFDKDGGLSDAALERLDLVSDEARSRGLKIVCVLANSNADYGGTEHFGGDFYTSTSAAVKYRAQVRRLLDHRGADGVPFRDRSAFLAWDLINEPRASATTSMAEIKRWVTDQAAFVGALDQRHLVTVGSEGFSTNYPADPRLAGQSTENFATLCSVPSVTLCSAHLYPKYLAANAGSAELGQVVQQWRATADKYNRPVIVGEVGYSLSDPGASEAGRRTFIDNARRALANSDLDGGYLWDVSATADNAFGLSFGDPESERVLGSWSNLPKR
ncbi:glycosyltransferase [Amnibacterium endophyticum]|uniref:Glycosyltransferase n=1 Tax=Amnibacterium endophyticum TaxID=2109337 RepID=A0ABW4LAW5_9MICO